MHRGHYAINYGSYQLFRETLWQDYSRIFEDSFSPRNFVIGLSCSAIGFSQEEILAPYIELDLRYNIDLLIVLTIVIFDQIKHGNIMFYFHFSD